MDSEMSKAKPSQIRFVSVVAKVCILLLIILNKVSIALYCYTSIAHIDLKNESNATLRIVKSQMTWDQFVDGTVHKLTMTNLYAIFTCLSAFVEMFTAQFLATPVFIAITTGSFLYFPNLATPLDPILYEFRWDRAWLLFFFAYYNISLLYEPSPIPYPEESGDYNDEIIYVPRDSSPAYKPFLMLLVQCCLMGKNYGVFLHLLNFSWPPAIEDMENDVVLLIRLVLLLEVIISAVGLFVVFLPSYSFIVLLFAALILLNTILYYRTVLILQWEGLGYSTMALAASVFFTYVIVLVDTGVIGVRQVRLKKVAEEEPEILKEEQTSNYGQLRFIKIITVVVILSNLLSHYHYCKLHISYRVIWDQLNARIDLDSSAEESERSESKSWIFYNPIYLIVIVAIVEFFSSNFNRTLFFMTSLMFLLLLAGPDYPPALDPILLHINLSQLTPILSFVTLCFGVVYKQHQHVPKIGALEYFNIRLEDKVDFDLMKRVSQVCTALFLNQANSYLIVHLQQIAGTSFAKSGQVLEGIARISFSIYMTMASGIIGLYGELHDHRLAKWLYALLLLFIVSHYTTIVIAPHAWQWGGLALSFFMMLLAVFFGLFYSWLTIAGINESEVKVPQRLIRYNRRRNRY